MVCVVYWFVSLASGAVMWHLSLFVRVEVRTIIVVIIVLTTIFPVMVPISVTVSVVVITRPLLNMLRLTMVVVG